VQFLGKFEALIETKKRIAVATFYVAKTPNSGNLISATTAQLEQIIRLIICPATRHQPVPNRHQ
jgi:hypothetical protein